MISFARDLGITPAEWSNEYWTCTWMPKFLDFVNNPKLAGLVLPSIHAFSGSIELRMKMFETAIRNGQQLLFADENLVVNDAKGLELVNRIYQLSDK